MKILLSAYACEPGRGSEPGVGWNNAKAIAQHHEVWVFTSNTHRSAIEAELVQNPNPNLHVVYFDPFGWVYDWSQEGKRASWDIHLHYYLWQIQAYLVGRSLHQQIGFDIIHHVTYVKYSSPSFLSLLPVPFIWGPVGGGESAPRAFWQDFNLRGKVYETARNLFRWFGEHDPFVRMTIHNSRIIFSTTPDTRQRLHSMGAPHVKLLSESGLLATEANQLAGYATFGATPIRFISMARLLHWKGLHLALQAFAQAKLTDAEYWILGEGPERERLEQLAEQLEIAHQVKFWNKLPRHEALQKLGECVALVHPSLHDSGGWVCLEAMAAGCPVICLDLGGPVTQVTEETGFKISAHTPVETIQGITAAMQTLASDRDLRHQLGAAGQKRVQEFFTWEHKGLLFSKLYKEITTSPEKLHDRVSQQL